MLALIVGARGYLDPAHVQKAIPFPVPPLHARFLGALYLSGFSMMLASMLARRWEEIRPIPTLTAIWTGGLGLISLFDLSVFPFERVQTIIWFAAYAIYPVIGAWLAWRHRGGSGSTGRDPRWISGFLWVFGTVLIMSSAALLIAPATMARVWPWEISALLARIYSAPLLAYGVGSLMVARRRAGDHARVTIGGTFVFIALVLLASAIHRSLFSLGQAADIAWFAGLVVATVGLAVLLLRSRPAT